MYQWFVVLHLAGLVVFALCHGAAVQAGSLATTWVVATSVVVIVVLVVMGARTCSRPSGSVASSPWSP